MPPLAGAAGAQLFAHVGRRDLGRLGLDDEAEGVAEGQAEQAAGPLIEGG